MRVLISGSSGLVGRALAARLAVDGHVPVSLRRTDTLPSRDEPLWAPIRAGRWADDIGDIDAVIHLAGENIAARRWTPARKRRIADSRVVGTRQLCEHLAGLQEKPAVVIAASAVGYYGDRGDEILTESSPSGSGFLAEVCRAWEAATQPATDAGIRVVNLRLGMVLASGGGALAKMLPLFKFGLGGKLGQGRQYLSWISLDDLIGAIRYTLTDAPLHGPVNAVAPNPVTNIEFTRSLGRALHRPTIFAVPAPVLRLATGEMADEMLLASTRVEPRKLAEAGFGFIHPDLDSALKAVIGRDD